MIYHITTHKNWTNALLLGFFSVESLEKEGFIHTSFKEQVEQVRARYYHNVPDLVLIQIDPEKVTALIKYELAPSVNEIFPHIYGTLNLDAVIEVSKL